MSKDSSIVNTNGIVRSIVWFAPTLRELRKKSVQLIEKVWRPRRDLNPCYLP